MRSLQRVILVVTAAALGMLLCRGAVAADWPEFRGPTGQGHAPPAAWPLSWSEEEHITWKVSLPGLGWSSPAIADQRIFLTTAIPMEDETQLLSVLCLDQETGRLLWEEHVFEQQGPVEIHQKNSHASPTPVVEGDRLYVHFGPHGTACLTRDGEVVWRNTQLRYSPQHGNGGSPAIAGDLLILCCDGSDEQYVVGLDKQTGELRWRSNRELHPSKGFSFCTPLIIEVEGRAQAICPGSDAVFAYDPASGLELWRVQYPDGYSVVPRPSYAYGLVYVCSGYNQPTLFAIDPTGSGDVTETHVRWRSDRNVPHNPSPLIAEGLVFMVSDRGVATCLDAQTGEERWQARLGGNFSSSPALAEGRVYFQDENGTCTVVAAAPEFTPLSVNSLDATQRTFASYAFSNGAIFLRSEGHLYRIEQ